MTAPGSIFVGRELELGWLTRQVRPDDVEALSPPVVLIFGPAGIGKTALIEAWLDHAGAKEKNMVSMRVSDSVGTDSLGDFVERLAHSARGLTDEFSRGAEAVLAAVSSSAASRAGSAAKPSSGYRSNGAIREARLPGEGNSGPADVQLADSVRRGLRSWLHKPDRRWSAETKPLLVVILERFEQYPPPLRFWLGRELVPALCSAREDWVCAFLLTGARSWAAGRQDEYWNVPAASRSERELGPLFFRDCVEWMRAAGQPLDLADAYYEDSQGLPGRFAELIARGPPGEGETSSKQKLPAILAPLSHRERRWIQAACFQRDCTPETLGILLGGEEGANAFAWLAGKFQADLQTKAAPVLRLREKHRSEVCSWMKLEMRLRWSHFQRQSGVFNQLRQKVPDGHDRTTLARFAPVRFFTPDLLDTLLAGDE